MGAIPCYASDVRSLDCVAVAIIAGLVVGAIDGIFAVRVDTELPVMATVLGCAAIVSTAAALLGCVEAAVLAAGRRQLSAARAWLDARLGLDPTADRGRVVRFHAIVLVAVPVAVAALLGLHAGLGMLWDSTEPELAMRLALFATAIVVAGSAVAVAVLAPLVARPVGWVDRTIGLPRPRNAGLRFVLYVALPVISTLAPFVATYEVELGTLALPFGVALFVVVQGLLWHAWRPLATRLDVRSPWPRRVLVVAWSVFALAAATTGQRSPDTRRGIAKATVAPPALAVLQLVTDFDRDGFSSLWTGNDCAPFDDSIYPLAVDVPDNGIDENCDDIDSGKAAQTSGARPDVFYGELPADEVRKYNIVLVIIDAARADKMGFLGAKKPATPYLDEFAKESVVFTQAYAQSSATMLSIPSMLCGLNPDAMKWEQKATRLSPTEDHEMLQERLGAAGYRTGVIVNHYFKKRLPGMLQGFDTVESSWLDGSHKRWFHRSATVATTQAIRFIEEDVDVPESDTPFFLVVYYESPHGRYNRHDDAGFPNFGKGQEALYTGEIAYADRHIGGLLDYLRYTVPLWDDTIVIVAADHGEEFGEHGEKYHARTCYREVAHVPLLVRIPGLEHAEIGQPVGLVDIVPTLLELTGGQSESDASELDGQSLLLPILAPERAWPDRPLFCSVISQTGRQGSFFRRSVRVGDRALMHELLEGTYELYDTRADPEELHDIAREPAEADTRGRLEDLLESSLRGNIREMQLTAG